MISKSRVMGNEEGKDDQESQVNSLMESQIQVEVGGTMESGLNHTSPFREGEQSEERLPTFMEED